MQPFKISKQTGTDNNGEPVFTTLPGVAVNTQEPVPEWEQYRVYPKTPQRVYQAPSETVHYYFPDEASRIEAMKMIEED